MSGKKSDKKGERSHACNLCQLTSLYTPPPSTSGELEMVGCQMLPLSLLPVRDGKET